MSRGDAGPSGVAWICSRTRRGIFRSRADYSRIVVR